jgi:general secretion pathway protein D
MRSKTRMRIFVSLLLSCCLLLMPLTAFANKKGDAHFKKGLQYETAQQWEKAAQEFTLAVAADPANTEYQLHFRRACFNASQAFMQQGRALAEQRDYVGAYNAFRQAYGYDQVNQLAVSEMERMLRLEAIKEGNPPPTTTEPSDSDQNGGGTPAKGQNTQEPEAPSIHPEQNRTIDYSGDLKSYIRILAEQLDLNVVFDRQSFAQPKTIDLHLKNVTTAQTLDYIFLQEGLFFQKLSRRTILVADQTRRAQYQQLVLRTFYLSNVKPEDARTIVQQAIPPSVGRPQTIVVPDKDTNSLTVRDTAENVRLIGELLQSLDKDRAEVVMDVNIYEVTKSDLLQLGNQIGNSTGFNIGGSPGLSVITSNGTLSALRSGVNLSSIVGAVPTGAAAALVIPSATLTAFHSKNNARLIASTQVHAFNNEESTARIGQRVPVQTASVNYYNAAPTATPVNGVNNGIFNNGYPVINYEPTGLTLKFTPLVFPNYDVQVKMSIESKDVAGASTLTPTFTERTITGTARVQNNRTMLLASVSQDIQSSGRAGLPVLGGLPLLGRLFTSPTKDNRQVDIVIAVTPRVLRAPAVTPRDEEMRPSGTLSNPTTGSIATVLRDAEREDRADQIALERQQKRNAAAQASNVPASSVPAATVSTNANANTNSNSNTKAAPSGNTQSSVAVVQPANAQVRTEKVETSGSEPLPFVPAPKSLISNQAANEVAAVNTGAAGATNAVLTSMPKPIETAVEKPAVSRIAQLKLAPVAGGLKIGEKQRVAVELKSDAPLGLAVLTLRFDPKVIKVSSVSAGTMFADSKDGSPSISQSIDPNGVCLISISALNGVAPMKGAGVLLFIVIEGVGAGDSGLMFDKAKTSLMATDARDVVLDLSQVQTTVKQ